MRVDSFNYIFSAGWCCRYRGQLAVGIVIGNADGLRMSRYTGCKKEDADYFFHFGCFSWFGFGSSMEPCFVI